MPRVLDLDPARYQPHWLHDGSRTWQETNCAADLWIEALHALGADPVVGLGFTLSCDFDGDQWRMFTFPAEDLRRLYGIEMDELNVWRPLVHHLDDQLSLGRLVIVDADAWHLPDTSGLTYQVAHQKTAIMVQAIDTSSRRLGYFHNAGYYELRGDDFDRLLGFVEPAHGETAAAQHLPSSDPPATLPPFALSVRLDRLRVSGTDAIDMALTLADGHLARQPASNPISRLRKRIDDDLSWLCSQELDTFHRYAFGTLRQCGANAELAATFCTWLHGRPRADRGSWAAAHDAAAELATVSTSMKSLEFALARVVRGRSGALDELFDPAERAWERALVHLEARS